MTKLVFTHALVRNGEVRRLAFFAGQAEAERLGEDDLVLPVDIEASEEKPAPLNGFDQSRYDVTIEAGRVLLVEKAESAGT